MPCNASLLMTYLKLTHLNRYGPNHPEMASKLTEMNVMLANVLERLNDSPEHKDSLLVVVGDHGMTSTGDHGGSTADETDSALFAFLPYHSTSSFQMLSVSLSCF